MYYSLKDKLNTRAAFYIVAGVLIVGFFVLGTTGRKSKKNDMISEQPSSLVTQSPQPENKTEISVYNHQSNEIMYMDIEDYVVGTVAKEMPASFSMEALKAQAIASRTIAYKYLSQKAGCNDCDICTSPSHVQGYATIIERKQLWGDEYSKWESVIEGAVLETSGEVMVFDGELIDVLYHASSNGQTENSVDVFSDSREYLVSVQSPDENLVMDEVTLSKTDFVNKVNKAYPSAEMSADKIVEQIRIVSYTISGRVEKIV